MQAAKISLAFAIVFSIITAGFAFMTKSKVEGLQGSLKDAKTTLTSTQQRLKTTEGDLKERTEELTTANKTIEEQKTSITEANNKVTQATQQVNEIQAKLAQNETDLATTKAELDKIRGTMPEVNPEEIAQKMKSMEEERNSLMTQLQEAKAVQETLNQKLTTAQESLATATSEVKRYQDGVERQGVTGRVVAVNPGWNFVVLDIGDRQGSAANAPIIISRNGQTIARGRVTSVEPSTSIADLIPGSIARGESVQPGDSVYFAGRQPVERRQPAGGAAPQPQQPANPS